MKKFALKAAVIAIAGYLGIVGYIHQYDKGRSQKNYLLKVITLLNNKRLLKSC